MRLWNQEQAIEHIDFNTIGLLVGMMIIVNILKRTGVFEYLAIRAAKNGQTHGKYLFYLQL